jgi:hypothetical protein
LLARRSFRAGTRVLVTGNPALAQAFAAQLQGTSVDALPVSETQVAHAVRTGMLRVLSRSPYALSRTFGRGSGHVLPLVRPASSDTLPASAETTSAGASPVQTATRRRRRPGTS